MSILKAFARKFLGNERVMRLLSELSLRSETLIRNKKRKAYSDRIARLVSELEQDGGYEVLGGMFAGTKYINLKLKESVPSAILPKLVGSYEDEINDFWEQIFTKDYPQFIDVGCAEGYYAVGFGLKNKKAKIYAYDLNEDAQNLCKQMAEANDFSDRIDVQAELDHQEMKELLATDGTLIMMDCESCEAELLDPAKVPQLQKTDILVEIHDFMNPLISTLIQERFAATHNIQKKQSIPQKDIKKYSLLESWPEEDARLALSEFRPAIMEWYYLTVKK